MINKWPWVYYLKCVAYAISCLSLGWNLNWYDKFLLSVIPLEDLPEFQVGFGFGVADKDKAKKPAYLKVIHYW